MTEEEKNFIMILLQIHEQNSTNSMALMYILIHASANKLPKSIATEQFNGVRMYWNQKELKEADLMALMKPKNKNAKVDLGAVALALALVESYKAGSATTLTLGERMNEPTIFFKDSSNTAFDIDGKLNPNGNIALFSLIAHELQHVAQIHKLAASGRFFLFDYVGEFPLRFLETKLKGVGEDPYRMISFEREAYALNEGVINVLFVQKDFRRIFDNLSRQKNWAQGKGQLGMAGTLLSWKIHDMLEAECAKFAKK